MERFQHVQRLLDVFIPKWPVHGNYFPLAECALSLEDIAYFNAVRCRTLGNAPPAPKLAENCKPHLARWLELLAPQVVVFIGKWAAEQGGDQVRRCGIPFAYMNRQRSLSTAGRAENRNEVIALVRSRDG
jgi:hypothetical protein